MTKAALTISHLFIRDRNVATLVDDVSLSVPRGGVLTLIGETGSGKSLIAQAVFGLLPSELSVSGIPQEPSLALDPTMRVKRQMALAGLNEQSTANALAALDLPTSTGEAYPFMLSGGMAQRVLVASALGVGAPVVIADEPTKGLDADRLTQVIATLKLLSAAGRSLLIITHDRKLAEELPGELAIFRSGRLIEHGPSIRLLSAPQSDYARLWLDADPLNWPGCQRCRNKAGLVLSAHDLAFGWPKGRMLFENVGIHLQKGRVLAISGPSGSGKSTLGDILLGLRRPLNGSVEWSGVNITANPNAIKPLRQRYQKLHQNPIESFVPHLTFARQFQALEDVKHDLSVACKLPSLLEKLRINNRLMDRLPSEVSGGEAQRLALARILLLKPIAIIADEPTSRLDPVVQRETMHLLHEIIDQEQLGLILISHNQALIAAFADDHLSLSLRP
jgi:peptide/nickel transport system ATP-binding protein